MSSYKFERGNFNESELEKAVVEMFEQEGYEYIEGEKIHTSKEILILEDLQEFILNRYAKENLSETELQKIINKISLINSTPLYAGNRETFFIVNEGFNLLRDDITKIALHVDYINFEEPEKNIFKVVTQYSVQGEKLRRPDLLIFVNGIPIAIFEFKSAIRENLTIYDAWKQIYNRYSRDIARLLK